MRQKILSVKNLPVKTTEMIRRRWLERWRDIGLPGPWAQNGGWSRSTEKTLLTWEGTWAVRRTGTQPVCKLFWVIIPGDSWAPYKLQTLVWELMWLWKSIQLNINPKGISWNKPMMFKANSAFNSGVLMLTEQGPSFGFCTMKWLASIVDTNTGILL